MDPASLMSIFQHTRKITEQLCEPLIKEDYIIQGMEDVSPPKWHLAHSSWFFEACILKHDPDYQVYHPKYHHLFNSYYQLLGTLFPRPQRGLLSRPTVDETYRYRTYITEQILSLLDKMINSERSLMNLIELGIHHEQQHQELLLMDIHYNFSLNPLYPAYKLDRSKVKKCVETPLNFLKLEEAVATIGADERHFGFDNERPQHKKIINSCALANRLISNQEYLNFINDKGYKNPALWLADGWDWRTKNNITNPLYWLQQGNEWLQFSLYGLQPLDWNAPVAHISFFEADAYAHWAGARLPTEEEWEHFVVTENYKPAGSNFLERNQLIPLSNNPDNKENPFQFFGNLWEWTSSAYTPYPGYKPFEGMIGEYNGKFMNNQRVLRGGSCLTPEDHIRASYRNFFQPDKRWHYCGIRLAKD